MALDAVELAREEASAGERHGNPDHQADPELQQSPSQHEPEDVSAVRAQRHANPDLTRAARHGVRRDAVESYARERERQDPIELGEPAISRSWLKLRASCSFMLIMSRW